MLRTTRFDIIVLLAAFAVISFSPSSTNIQLQVNAQANPALGTWSILPVQHIVTCIHSFLVPGPAVPAPGQKPKLVCVERPHSGGQGKYPPNKYTERANSAEVDLTAPAGTPLTVYAKKSNSITNPFCGGHAQMADGNIYLAGGDQEAFVDPVTGVNMLTDGTNIKRVYTPYDASPKLGNPWETSGAAMAKGRWYPTVHTVHDGSQIIVGGVAAALNLDDWQAGKRTVNPTYEFNVNGLSKGPAVTLQLLQNADPWNLYPVVQQMPMSGNIWIFSGGPSVLLGMNGNVTNLPPMTDVTHHPRIYPFTSTAVMLPLREKNGWQATMMVCGGTLRDAGVRNTTIASTGNGSPFCSKVTPEGTKNTWDENFVQFAGEGKVMPDVVLLPDGKVLFVNGATWGTAGGDAGVCTNAHSPSFQTQIFDPETSTFARGPDYSVARLYHSGALLLPDGRVITTGNEEANWMDLDLQPSKVLANQCFPFTGPLNNRSSANNIPTAGCTDPFEYRIEAFTPAYLTLPNKPVITLQHGITYPAQITYGSNFAIQFDTDATDIASISFIRYATTTHSTNSDQRFVELPIRYQNATHVLVEGPLNGFIAQPGNWMLFPVAKNGAVGHSVTIRVANGPPSRIPVPSPVPTGAQGLVPTVPPAGGFKAGAAQNKFSLGLVALCVYSVFLM